MSYSDYLKKEILKTGFPLEIEISSKLDKEWQNVINTDSYYDNDEKKLRDIDIVAYDEMFSDKILPICLFTGLVIECKKDINLAWVFFTRPFDYCVDSIEGQYIDETQVLTKNTENSDTMGLVLEKTPLHYSKFERKAVTYCTIYLEGKNNSVKTKKRKIFQAQNQLKKYVGTLIDQLLKKGPQIDFCPIGFYIPCIVFDGLMYEAIVEEGKLKVTESNHMLLETTYRSPYSISERCILIDVVHKNYFTDYQKMVRKDALELKKIVRKKAKKINNEFYKINRLLSSSKK